MKRFLLAICLLLLGATNSLAFYSNWPNYNLKGINDLVVDIRIPEQELYREININKYEIKDYIEKNFHERGIRIKKIITYGEWLDSTAEQYLKNHDGLVFSVAVSPTAAIYTNGMKVISLTTHITLSKRVKPKPFSIVQLYSEAHGDMLSNTGAAKSSSVWFSGTRSSGNILLNIESGKQSVFKAIDSFLGAHHEINVYLPKHPEEEALLFK